MASKNAQRTISKSAAPQKRKDTKVAIKRKRTVSTVPVLEVYNSQTKKRERIQLTEEDLTIIGLAKGEQPKNNCAQGMAQVAAPTTLQDIIGYKFSLVQDTDAILIRLKNITGRLVGELPARKLEEQSEPVSATQALSMLNTRHSDLNDGFRELLTLLEKTI